MKSIKKTLLPLFPVLLLIALSCSKNDVPEAPKLPEVKKDNPKTVSISANYASMPMKGTITVQFADSPLSEGIEKIIDNNPDTKFSIDNPNVWIIWKSDSAFIASEYFIISATDTPECDPKSWSLSASNDGNSWTALNSIAYYSFSERKQKKTFTLVHDIPYQYYKLVITENNGGTKIQIADWGIVKKKVVPKSVRVFGTNISMPTEGVMTVQYSDCPKDEDINKLTDNDKDTKLIVKYNKVWITWKADKAVPMKEYFMTSADNAPENDPKSWTLSASDDSVTWKLLDSQTNFTFDQRKDKKRFPIKDETPFKFFKLDITANNGGSSTQLAEWGLVKLLMLDDLMQFARRSTHSSITPMGIHYENRHITTDADKIWLNDAGNEPPVPASQVNVLMWKELSVTLYPFGSPTPADINQHDIGDCGGIASLASMAYLYPDLVKSIIKDNGDKTYTIQMFDPQANPIQVTVSSQFLVRKDNSRIAAVSSKYDRACWSTILEKAIIKYNAIYKVSPDINGILKEVVPALFTGNGDSFNFDPFTLTNEQLERAVKAALQEGRFIVGGFREEKYIGNAKTVTYHAYTAMFTNVTNALFCMRNPWGFSPGTDGKEDGVLHILNDHIPPLIDVCIMRPGKAGNLTPNSEPYIAPSFSSVHVPRVNAALMRSGM